MLTIRPISSDLADVAKTELNEDPYQLKSQLEVLNSWLNECAMLCGTLNDQILLSFLRGCKFSLVKTKEKLSLFYRIRTILRQVVQNRDPFDKHVLQVIKLGVGIPLPETASPIDPRIFIIRVAQFDLEKCSFADVIKIGTMINDIMMRDDDQVVICGMCLIIDLARVTAAHLFQFEMEFLRQVAILYQDASPFRMRGIHILNPPPGLHTVMAIFNSLLSQKNQDKRIFVHGSSLSSLHKHFPREILPTEYDGLLGPIQTCLDFWEMKLRNNRDYLLEMAELRDSQAEEAQRIQLPLKQSVSFRENDFFGIDGSFRKLELD
ncbi:alpha-tocopherol transfer protein-like [Topomyia yanbarensis]|uniref:alpha-tocopherol transfer protein-like n=1 Tax=Topomyia yanbarensis TaxID=2498891 RepID=UPI00273C674B|nr:alpha-tocopherol transfer protein-like [Topomyia yanbarensis]